MLLEQMATVKEAAGFEFYVEVKGDELCLLENVCFLRKIPEEKEEAGAKMKEEFFWSKLICTICFTVSQNNPCCCILVF